MNKLPKKKRVSQSIKIGIYFSTREWMDRDKDHQVLGSVEWKKTNGENCPG